MKRGFTISAILTSLFVIGASAGRVEADETATIQNESNHTVRFYLKWSHLPFESQRIDLLPGQRYTTRGPDGTALFIRYNSTPTENVFPRELSGPIATRFTAAPQDLGMFSCFRNVTPWVVNLFLP